MAKKRICKGCLKEIENPQSSLQQTHQNYKCYQAWQKTKKKTQEQKLRKAAGKDLDALIRQTDALFQQAIAKLFPESIVSGFPTEVAHHWIYKSHSNFLRYYIPNGIPLTNDEHGTVHGPRPETMTTDIVIKMGQERLEDLKEKSKIRQPLNLAYVQEKKEELIRFIEEI